MQFIHSNQHTQKSCGSTISFFPFEAGLPGQKRHARDSAVKIGAGFPLREMSNISLFKRLHCAKNAKQGDGEVVPQLSMESIYVVIEEVQHVQK